MVVYRDEYNATTGVITRNVGIKVLDGTENWMASAVSNVYYSVLSNSVFNADIKIPIPSTHFVGTDELNANMPNNSIKLGASIASTTNDAVFVKMTSIGDLTEFKAFLAQQYASGTPVIIVYPLKTATTETVTAQPMNIQEGTNIVEITQASMDNLELEVKYKAGVSVTITEVENAQLDDNVEVTING